MNRAVADKPAEVENHIQNQIRFNVTKKDYDASEQPTKYQQEIIARETKSFMWTVNSGKLNNEQITQKMCDKDRSLSASKNSYESARKSAAQNRSQCVSACKAKRIEEVKTGKTITPMPTSSRPYCDSGYYICASGCCKFNVVQTPPPTAKQEKTIINRVKRVFNRNVHNKWE
jgi:hypothetical protein